jgi:hypothetical protein
LDCVGVDEEAVQELSIHYFAYGFDRNMWPSTFVELDGGGKGDTANRTFFLGNNGDAFILPRIDGLRRQMNHEHPNSSPDFQ